MGKVRVWCPKCGGRLESDEIIKNTRVPNKFRKNIYHCPNCSMRLGKDVIIGLMSVSVPENKFYESIDAFMFQAKPKSKTKREKS